MVADPHPTRVAKDASRRLFEHGGYSLSPSGQEPGNEGVMVARHGAEEVHEGRVPNTQQIASFMQRNPAGSGYYGGWVQNTQGGTPTTYLDVSDRFSGERAADDTGEAQQALDANRQIAGYDLATNEEFDPKQRALPGIMQPNSVQPGSVTTTPTPAPHPSREQKMTRAENLDAGQLPMFMSGQEIKDRYQFLPADLEEHGGGYFDEEDEDEASYTETTDDAWDRKLEEAWDSGLVEHMESEGSTVPPVHLAFKHYGEDTPTIAGGHHRIAALADMPGHPDLPVRFHTDVKDAFNLRTIDEGWSDTRFGGGKGYQRNRIERAAADPNNPYHEAAKDYQGGWRYH